MSFIASRDNPRVRRWRTLTRDARERRKQQRAMIEGENLISAFLQSGKKVENLILSKTGSSNAAFIALTKRSGKPATVLADLVFRSIAETDSPDGIAAEIALPGAPFDPKSSAGCVFLERVQDPGNVGAILRLCQGFNASALLVESADVTSPKVVRSSAGALFSVPWIDVARGDASAVIKTFDRGVYRLERKDDAKAITTISIEDPIVLIVGSEGQGIHLDVDGTSVMIAHDPALESLNVGHALAIALFLRSRF